MRKTLILSLGLSILILAMAETAPAGKRTSAGPVNQSVLQSEQNLNAELVLTEIPLDLVSVSDEIVIRWMPEVSGVLRYSPLPGGGNPSNYPYTIPPDSLLENRPGTLRFRGSAMSTGVWYAIVTSSSGSSIEFLIIREADVSPRMIAPITASGAPGIQTTSPEFQWEPVPGVPFYHVILSDQPFTVEEDEEGNTVARGANIIWQAITPNTSILYGTPDPSGFLSELQPPPLVSGVRYNWIVLNNYGNNPALTSNVTSGPAGFSVDVPAPFDPPVNLVPEPGAMMAGQTITFSWTTVPDAVLYHLYISKYEDVRGSQALVPIWHGISTEPVLDFDARMILQDGYYVWKVLAQDDRGGGAMGDTTGFFYSARSAWVYFHSYKTDGSLLPRVNLSLVALEGNQSPFPLATDDGGFLERELPLGRYRVEATKEGYEDTSAVFELTREGEAKHVNLYLRPSPSTVYGSVQDDQGAPLAYATVSAHLVDSNDSRQTSTGPNGRFVLSLSPGTWDVTASKTGYVSSQPRRVTVGQGQRVSLDSLFNGPFVLQERRYTLSGRVTTPDGQPVWNASVTATSGESRVQALTDAAGNYSMRLNPGSWTLTASKEGYAASQPVTVTVSDHDVTVDLRITPRANVITGTVSASGQPLASATVRATPASGSPIEATTNTLGEYRLSLPAGDYEVQARKTGYAASEVRTFSLTYGQTISGVNFQLTPLTAWVEGTTSLPNGSPLAGVTIRSGDAQVTSDAQGQFRLGLPPGTHTLSASKQGYISPTPIEITLAPGQTLRGIDFVLTPNASVLSGTVTSGGQPVVGATVSVRSGATLVAEATSNDQGTYTLSIAAGTYVLRCSKLNFVSEPESIQVQVGPGQTRTDLNFVLRPQAATLTGRVLTEGTPVRSATVTAVALDDPAIAFGTQTGADGAYTLRLTPNHAYLVRAAKTGYISAEQETQSLAPASTHSLEFNLTPQQSLVFGVVMDTSGSPLASATVTLSGQTRSYSAQTDPQGQFRIGVLAGSYTLSATQSGYLPFSTEIQVAVGDTVGPVQVELVPNFGALNVLVTDRFSGNPVSGARVVASEGGTGSGGTATTDQSGSAHLSDLVPGVYKVRAEASGYEAQEKTGVVVPGGTTVSVDLRLRAFRGSIAGVCRIGTEPAPGVTVVARDSVGNSFSAVTDQAGSYQLSALRPGIYSVQASLAGYRSDGEKQVQVIDRSTARADFTLLPNDAGITGLARTSAGSPLAGVIITAIGASGNSGADTTGADGSYSMTSLAPDTYTVRARIPGYTPAPAETTIALGPGQTQQLNFTLTRNTLSVSGKVIDQLGRGLAGVAVQATDGQNTWAVTTDDQGTYVIPNAAPNSSVRLSTVITKQGYDNADTTVQLGLQSIQDLHLRVIVHRATIRGNASLAGAQVRAQHAGTGRVQTTYSGPDGSYSLTNLYTGTYTVVCSKSGYVSEPSERNVTISQPDQSVSDVDFELQELRIAVSGRVLSANTGLPLQDAPVKAVWPDGQISSRSDASGNFTLSDLPPNTAISVGTTLPPEDFDNVDTTFTTGSQDMQLAALRVGVHDSRITVHVQANSGIALQGATVLVAPLDTVLTTGAGGLAVLEHLEPGSYSLRAEAPGFRPADEQRVELDEHDSVLASFSLQSLESALYGTIRFQGGALRYAIVYLLNVDSTQLACDTTGVNGSYSFENLEVGRDYLVSVTKTGFVDTTAGPFRVSASGTPVDIELRHEPLAISGVVKTQDGRRVAGARIVAVSLTGQSYDTTSNEFGEFELVPLPPTTYVVTSYLDTLASIPKVVDLATENFARTQAVLKPAAVLRGFVRYDSQPVSGARVSCTNTETGLVASAPTDQNGEFEIVGLVAGRYAVTCEAEGFEADPPVVETQLQEGETKILELRMKPLGLTIAGRVVDQDLLPLHGAEVAAKGPGGRLSDRTDRNGSYIIEDVPQGIYVVEASLFGYRSDGPDTVEVAPGQPAVANFQLTAILNRISGTVRDSLTGEQLPGVVVTAASGGQDWTDTTDSQGRYLLELEPGTYAVTFAKSGYVTVGPIMVDLVEGRPVDLSVALDRVFVSSTVSGVVTRRGAGLPGILVVLEPRVSRFSPDSTYTDAEGHFRFEDVPSPVPYRLRAISAEYGTLTSPVFELPAEGYSYTFRYPAAQIQLRLTEDGQVPFTLATVTIVGPGVNLQAQPDPQGWVRTSDRLPGGSYSIEIAAPDSVVAPTPFALTLPQDSVLVLPIYLPFRVHAPESVRVSEPAQVLLASAVEPEDTLWLYYRGVGSSAYRSAAFTRSDTAIVPAGWTGYVAAIPPQVSTGTVLLYARTAFRGLEYSGRLHPIEMRVTGSGVLARAELASTVHATTVGVPVMVEARAYDLSGARIEPDSVDWKLVAGEGHLTPLTDKPSRAIFRSDAATEATIRATVKRGNRTASASLTLVAEQKVLKSLQVTAERNEISNRESIRLYYAALDTSGQLMTIWPIWSLKPGIAGKLDLSEDGQIAYFRPDSNFIGQVFISVKDSLTGTSARFREDPNLRTSDRGLLVYHVATATSPSQTLTDGEGFYLRLPPSPSPEGIQLRLRLKRLDPPPAKRVSTEYELVTDIYRVDASASLAPGKKARIVFPVQAEGGDNLTVARWDPKGLKWEPLPTVSDVFGLAAEVESFSEFAVLQASEPLDVKDVQLLPNPFTPNDPFGLQISFRLTSQEARKPFVTVRIYNMAGELVRTLCKDLPMAKGTYEPGDPATLHWDGRTDDGALARNGRYIVRIQVRDGSGSEEVFKTAVLIK